MESSMQKHIPDKILAQIFLPLPAKTLLRLRCVCKLWNQVIISKFFIKSHHAQQKNSSSHAEKYLLLGGSTTYSTHLVDSESNNKILESQEYELHDICGRNLPNYDLDTYGVCHGLLCLSHAKQDLYPDYPIFLWNPVIRKAKKLPPLIIDDIRYIDHSYLCFGYHDDDYKVINMVPLRGVYHVYVYSLSTDSWKFFKFMNTNSSSAGKFDICPYPKARFVNGVAYFVQEEKSSGRIVCFDLSCEIIREINLPDELNNKQLGVQDLKMEEYRESIAILDNTANNAVMWVLRVNNNSIIWDKKFAFRYGEEKNHYSYYLAMGFMNKDELLLCKINLNRFSSQRNEYFMYNVENNFQQPLTFLEKLDLGKYDYDRCPWRIYELTESIVLLTETTTPCQKMKPCSANENNQKSD